MNVYANFHGLDYDTSSEKLGHIIVRGYQIIPKYWLNTSPDHRMIILNWTVGSGKTIGGLLTVLRLIKARKMNELNKTFTQIDIKLPKALIIGEWMTTSAIEAEMCRPEFALGQYDSKEHYIKNLKKYITFIGYQGLVSNLFPSYVKQGKQAVEFFLNDYNTGRLIHNDAFIESIRGTTVVVDEMQRLYSRGGLNSYGFAVAYLVKNASKFDLKFAMLTGTIFNTSIVEFSEVANVTVVDEPAFFNRDDYFNNLGMDGSLERWKFKNEQNCPLIPLVRQYFMYYSRVNKVVNYESVEPGVIRSLGVDIENYPLEYIIGTVEIGPDLTIHGIRADGEQMKVLLTTNLEPEDDEDGNISSVISPYDAVLPEGAFYDKTTGVYDGDFLFRSKIGNYSALAAFIIDEVLANVKKDEKTVMYHQKVRSFGVLQYGRILEKNGLVRYGEMPVSESICRNCWTLYKEHSPKCESFSPIYYASLHGGMSAKDRQRLVNNVYNSPSNIRGELISALLISDVAYVGVTLLATNNMYLLSPVSNISKLRQILARINRFKSHSALPPEKRFVKNHIMAVCTAPVDDVNNNKMMRYYRARYEAASDVNSLVERLRKESLGEKLLEKPAALQLTEEEKRAGASLLYEDIVDCLRDITTKVQVNDKTNTWREELLIQRVKDPKHSLSFMNLSQFPDNLIRMGIRRSPHIELFYNRRLNLNFVKGKNIVDKTDAVHYPPMKFVDIESDKLGMIDGLMKIADRLDYTSRKASTIRRILNILASLNDFSPLIGWETFWQWIYHCGGEYYDDDETKYFQNHLKANRSYDKMTGAYILNGKILLRSGGMRTMRYTFIPPVPYKETGYTFKMEPRNGFVQLVAYLFEAIFVTDDKLVDCRHKSRGLQCVTAPECPGFQKLGLLPTTVNRYEGCTRLIEFMCQEQLKVERPHGYFFFSPFMK